MTLDENQLKAVDHAVNSQFAIITGGAGTGKTTIIKEILEQLKAQRKTVYMCAFAGKAAARLKEATGQEASTIHRMLGFMGTKFTLDTLKGISVILDEASMVDSELLAEIVKRCPEKLILVGDAAQLPPVGKGQPFHDLINLRSDVVHTLTKCYRNSEAVFKAATAIRNGAQVLDRDESENEKWAIIQTGDPDKTHAAIVAKAKEGYFDFDQDIILCPKNGSIETPATVDSLNTDIAATINPRAPDQKFVAGDRVMNTKNLPEKDIWNGTTGKIAAVNTDGGVHMILDEPVIDWAKSKPGEIVHKDQVHLSKGEAKELKLAYAMTVHKSQGSQYRRVIFVCLSRDVMSLTRPLIYTAVTRTKQQCIVAGERWAFNRGCQNVTRKSTVLQQLASGEI